jgi:DNA helicase-2/ATP-dependent DNA helicase PcrA
MNIAYKIFGGLSFYQRKEVKDMLAYLRVIANTKDEEALKRIINYPARGIGKTTLERAVIVANENDIPMYDVLEKATAYGLKGASVESIVQFVQMIRYFQSMLTKANAYEVAFQVGKHTGLVKELFNDKSAEGLARYENIQELLNSIKEFTETPADFEDGEVGDKSLGSYLQQIALLTDADNQKDDADVVSLMTIHAAKGLEFPCVFVGGMEETLFPSAMSINTREELEEERRLFYVAVTRAKSRLWLTYAQSRYRFGQLTANEPSRFLTEVPEEYVDKTMSGGGVKNQGSFGFGNSTAYERLHGAGRGLGFGEGGAPVRKPNEKPAYLAPKPVARVVEHTPAADFVPSDTSGLEAGMKVEHQKFGFGTVTKMEGSAHNPIATVEFDKNGEKKIMLNYAKLRIVE